MMTLPAWFEIDPARDALGGGRYLLADPWGDWAHVGERIPVVFTGQSGTAMATVVSHVPGGEAVVEPDHTPTRLPLDPGPEAA